MAKHEAAGKHASTAPKAPKPKNRKARRAVAILLVCVILLGAAGGGGYYYLQHRTGKPVDVFPANQLGSTDSWYDQVNTGGQVRADRMQAVYLTSTQTVTDIFVTEGQQVQVGDPILAFDTTLDEVELIRKKIDIQQLNLELDEARKTLKEIDTYRVGSPGSWTPKATPTPVPPEPTTVPWFQGGTGTAEDPYVFLWDEDMLLSDLQVEQLLLLAQATPTPLPTDSAQPDLSPEPGGETPVPGPETETAALPMQAEPVPAPARTMTVSRLLAQARRPLLLRDPPEEQAEPTEEPAPTEAPAPTEEPIPTEEPTPTEEPAPTEEPVPTAEPTQDPAQTAAPEVTPTGEPAPTEGPTPTGEPTQEPTQTAAPEMTPTPVPTGTPIPTPSPVPSATPEPSASPEVSPEASTSPLPGPETGEGGYYIVFEIRQNDSMEGDILRAFELRFVLGGQGWQKNWLYTVVDTSYEPQITLPDDDFDLGYFDPGIYYSASEIKQMRAQTKREITDKTIQLKMAEQELKQVEYELSNGEVLCTTAGVVKSVLDPDEALESDEPVVRVSGGGGYFITGYLSEFDLQRMHVGDTVTVENYMAGEELQAAITDISPYPATDRYVDYYSTGVNNNTSKYPFTVEADEDANLREGYYVNITFSASGAPLSEEGTETFYLENAFLRTEGARSYVYAAGEDGLLEKRYVTTGKNLYGSLTEIKGGLDPDTDYLAFPYGRNVKAGAPVTLQQDISVLYGY